ncbi:nucleotidyltransferase domain-containing protein [Hamadaea tsunoensis]|uniref:nucleotidyltransferase domain-containing protein n=1 Tax=Hamadaea tsunoensis TaxID=53368 RepID=UPI0003F68906|nr:nucleotidyltransferase domain-containing protein [Hamadaea tsunoensis]
MNLPKAVAGTLARYLSAVDASRPGLVEGLYVTGSVALDAYRPGRSDIDTVIVTSRPLGAGDIEPVRAAHTGFDGVYLDRETFDRFPADQPVVPFVVGGELVTDRPCGELHPVLWLLLARHGIGVRGPAPAELAIPFDAAALRRYNLTNLHEYWEPLAAQVRAATDGVDDGESVPADSVDWMILGPGRLHYTLAYEAIVGKPGVAAYLGEFFPQWSDLAERAVRWRAGEEAAFTVRDLRAAADAAAAVIADADRRFG